MAVNCAELKLIKAVCRVIIGAAGECTSVTGLRVRPVTLYALMRERVGRECDVGKA